MLDPYTSNTVLTVLELMYVSMKRSELAFIFKSGAQYVKIMLDTILLCENTLI